MQTTLDLTEYLHHQTIEETIEVLDEVLAILVVHAEVVGVSEGLGHQYLTIRNLRELLLSVVSSQ